MGAEREALSIRTLTLLLAALLAVPVLAPFASSDAGPLAFSTPVRVGMDRGEPGLRMGHDGRLWVHYPGGLHVSTDGGASWAKRPLAGSVIFGGDADMAVLRDGSLLYADLSGFTISVARSLDASGAQWVQNQLASDLPLVDRQWLETGRDPITGAEVVYLVYNQQNAGLRVVRSTTGGVVFEQALTVPPAMGFNCFRGNLAVSPQGTVYLADCAFQGPKVWVSEDGGLTWATRFPDFRVTGFSSFLFTNVATDAAGNLYMAWVERGGGETNVWLSASGDHGVHWTPKQKLTTSTSAGVMPWLVGGDAGRVGVAWYAADRQGDAGSMPNATEWRVKYALVEDALGARAVTEAFVSDDVIQRGFICGAGTGCSSGGRNLLDFFQVQKDADGHAMVVYADGCDGCASPATSRSAKITFARQSSGPTLTG